jgi:tRNA threonylcarbamoyl adenosine modification protein YeaZ
MAVPTGAILAIDTATTEAVIAIGTHDGTVIAADAWVAGYRHGEELLARVDALLTSADASVRSLGGLVVGTGPGAFTGLRVGIATAKGLAIGLGIPLAGIPSAAALAAAAADEEPALAGIASAAADEESAPAGRLVAVLLPAGPSERTLVFHGAAIRLRAGEEPDLPAGTAIVAVDLPGRAPADALALGAVARRGFAAALVRLGATRLAETGGDDVAQLVPEYVTPPRGVTAAHGEVAWSRTRG